MVNKCYFKVLLSALLWSLAACSNEVDEKLSRAQVVPDSELATITLPDISHQPVRLSVASVVNPRFKQLSDVQIKKILLRGQQMVKQYFNVEIEFSDVQTLPIKDVFDRLDSQVIANRKDEIVNVDLIDKQAREAMQQALFKTLSNYSGNRQNVIDYAQPYLLRPLKLCQLYKLIFGLERVNICPHIQ